MDFKWGLYSFLSAYLMTVILALPSSLVEEIKNSETKISNKVKRAQTDQPAPEESIGRMSYYNDKPASAIKRGTNLKEADLGEWTGGDQLFRGADFSMDNFQSGLFNSPNLPLDDKTVAEYEKGYRYGTNKDKLDEALENAVLKGDMLYTDPYNQYRYYGDDVERRRKRRDVSNNKLRQKRNIDLSPEEMLALLALYHQNQRELSNNVSPYDFSEDEDDETWLNGPVYPYGSRMAYQNNNLFNHPNSKPLDLKQRWGTFDTASAKKKRFIVAKKRTNDPTRMIRYINGPSQNDFNTLSDILNNQKEPINSDVPVFRRFVL